MKIKFTSLLAALFCMGVTTAMAQTASEIIDQHLNALGGKEKLRTLKSLYMEGTSVLQNGAEITQKIWKVDGKLMRQEIESAMFNMTTVVTDKEGWRKNPRTGQFEAMPAEAFTQMQSELDCAGPLLDYAQKGHQAELLGKEDVDGVPCWKVKLTLKSGREITYFIDATTHYIVRTAGPGGWGGGGGGGRGGNREAITDFADYRKNEDGFVFPYKVTIVGGMGGSLFYETIRANQPVDAKAYQPKDL